MAYDIFLYAASKDVPLRSSILSWLRDAGWSCVIVDPHGKLEPTVDGPADYDLVIAWPADCADAVEITEAIHARNVETLDRLASRCPIQTCSIGVDGDFCIVDQMDAVELKEYKSQLSKRVFAAIETAKVHYEFCGSSEFVDELTLMITLAQGIAQHVGGLIENPQTGEYEMWDGGANSAGSTQPVWEETGN